MAKLNWNGWTGFSFSKLNLNKIKNALVIDSSSKKFIAHYDDAPSDAFSGSSLKYGSDGYPTGGTITSYKMTNGSDTLGSISGVKISAASLGAAAHTSSKADDLAIYKAAFSKNDTIIGSKYSDKLEGFSGNDKITGGGGKDKLYGGLGADKFIFKNVEDAKDTIYDLSRTQKDKIDLRGIDAKWDVIGNQAFKFISTADFSQKAGELRYQKVAGGICVQGDVQGDGHHDFNLYLKGLTSIAKGDFYL